MKVLQIHVGNNITKDESLGDERYLLRNDILTGDKQYYRKHDIINADRLMHSIMNEGVEIIHGHFSSRKSMTSLLKAGMIIRKLCKTNNPDLVHVLWGGTTSLITVLFSPKPVVISFCGSDLLGTYTANGRKKLSGRINGLFSQVSALFASKIITKSEQLKHRLWIFSRKKATVIPNGVDLDHFTCIDRNTARLKLGWNHHAPVMLFFGGNNQRVKNKPLALQIFARVHQEIPDLRFEEVYDIPHELMPYYYNAADIMILTSFHEGSNNSIKEALACNLPVVAVNVGDVEKRLGGVSNSSVVNSYDPVIISGKVTDILKNGRRSDGRIKAKEFEENKIAHDIISIYKQIPGK